MSSVGRPEGGILTVSHLKQNSAFLFWTRLAVEALRVAQCGELEVAFEIPELPVSSFVFQMKTVPLILPKANSRSRLNGNGFSVCVLCLASF